MIAFETRYEVSTQVDSSALTDRFPAMCGSATFAIDVSSTSMNVASVTVTAITHGLIDPSGIRSFDLIPSSMFQRKSLPWSVRNYGRFHVHARPQHRHVRGNRIEHDLYRNALHHFHVVARRIFRRQQAQHRSRGPRERIHMPRERLAVRVDIHIG